MLFVWSGMDVLSPTNHWRVCRCSIRLRAVFTRRAINRCMRMQLRAIVVGLDPRCSHPTRWSCDRGKESARELLFSLVLWAMECSTWVWGASPFTKVASKNTRPRVFESTDWLERGTSVIAQKIMAVILFSNRRGSISWTPKSSPTWPWRQFDQYSEPMIRVWRSHCWRHVWRLSTITRRPCWENTTAVSSIASRRVRPPRWSYCTSSVRSSPTSLIRQSIRDEMVRRLKLFFIS